MYSTGTPCFFNAVNHSSACPIVHAIVLLRLHDQCRRAHVLHELDGRNGVVDVPVLPRLAVELGLGESLRLIGAAVPRRPVHDQAIDLRRGETTFFVVIQPVMKPPYDPP